MWREKKQPARPGLYTRMKYIFRLGHPFISSLSAELVWLQGACVGTTSVTPSIIQILSCISQFGLFMSAGQKPATLCESLHYFCVVHIWNHLMSPRFWVFVAHGLSAPCARGNTGQLHQQTEGLQVQHAERWVHPSPAAATAASAAAETETATCSVFLRHFLQTYYYLP